MTDRPDAAMFQLDRSPVYDVLVSASLLAYPPQGGRWAAWAQGATQQLSGDERRQLQRWFAGTSAVGMALIALIPVLPDARGVTEFLHHITQIPYTDFLRLILTSGPTHPDAPLTAPDIERLSTHPVDAQRFLDQYLRVHGRQRAILLRMLADPEAARTEFAQMIDRYQQGAYPQIAATLSAERAQAYERLQTILQKQGEGWPEWLVSLSHHYGLTGFSSVALAVSAAMEKEGSVYYHETQQPLLESTSAAPFITIVSTRTILKIAPAGQRQGPVGATPTDALQRYASVLSLLSDPARLRILRRLRERSYFGQELAQTLGLSGGTISHHMTQLIHAGFVSVERVQRRTYFRIERENLEQALQDIHNYLRSDEALE